MRAASFLLSMFLSNHISMHARLDDIKRGNRKREKPQELHVLPCWIGIKWSVVELWGRRASFLSCSVGIAIPDGLSFYRVYHKLVNKLFHICLYKTSIFILRVENYRSRQTLKHLRLVLEDYRNRNIYSLSYAWNMLHSWLKNKEGFLIRNQIQISLIFVSISQK